MIRVEAIVNKQYLPLRPYRPHHGRTDIRHADRSMIIIIHELTPAYHFNIIIQAEFTEVLIYTLLHKNERLWVKLTLPLIIYNCITLNLEDTLFLISLTICHINVLFQNIFREVLDEYILLRTQQNKLLEGKLIKAFILMSMEKVKTILLVSRNSPFFSLYGRFKPSHCSEILTHPLQIL